MRHFSGKFDQHLSLCCGSVKLKFNTGPGYWFLWESCELRFTKFTDNFWHSFFKYTFKSSSHFYPIEITGRKMVRSVCLKPVSMETWRLHTLWRFTVPAYIGYMHLFDANLRSSHTSVREDSPQYTLPESPTSYVFVVDLGIHLRLLLPPTRWLWTALCEVKVKRFCVMFMV